MQQRMLKKYLLLPLLAVLCIPLFFLNMRDNHDWGDDFAQYILQAKNIAEGKSQAATGFISDEKLPAISPKAYPSGFPLMLAGIYAWKGNSILAFSYLITTFLFLLCLVMFIFFRRYFSGLASLLLVLIFAYNPWTLNAKAEILSDIPFSFFFLGATLLYLNRTASVTMTLLTGIACGIMISIRAAGFVFLVSVLIHL